MAECADRESKHLLDGLSPGGDGHEVEGGDAGHRRDYDLQMSKHLQLPLFGCSF